jgi:uncharacterized protein (DUF488 family)
MGKLLNHRVVALVDVRKNAISRKKGFSKTALSERLARAGITYYHFPDVGIPSEMRKGLKVSDPDTYSVLFEYYDNEIVPKARDTVETIKQIATEQERIAITCFEADHRFCHRHRLTKAMQDDQEFSGSISHI